MESVEVNKKAAARFDAGHPWIFRSDLTGTEGLTSGETVRVVCGPRDLGTAHYSGSSQIALRMLSPRVEPADLAFFTRKLEAAIAFRKQVVRDTDAYRLVYAEADGLPALIIDRYAGYLVLQALDQGMDRATALVTEALNALLHPAGILARNDSASRTQEELPREVRVLGGTFPDSISIRMNGLAWQVDPRHGMKTGIFLDQRENYVAAANHARGTALDCFTSTGGFALHLAAKCERVEAVDSSEPAIAAAQRNAVANGIGNIDFREADAFEALAGYAAARRKFETIVLDPPAYAKSRSQVEAARAGLQRDQPARAAAAVARRRANHLFLLPPCERSRPVGGDRGSGARNQTVAAHPGTAHAGVRSSGAADGARNLIPEVPDCAGRQNSCVTRITSSEVVTPCETFSQPSSRSWRMPLRLAA